ncbi:omega-hydroxypalmitate O-feruloyl transferase [Dorcoceras hygrometricum]|uniref:Omega-hydroxypalmitate O-feruloyl transferase n=1 Tax=Dorcoceras hygrometricum TaxID=472368 RepID=A0A2Z7BCC1_9LAMI|nr:omega-hydroxypalmitate O-feruloyl transferase [Dorcoceras hygrometricum]
MENGDPISAKFEVRFIKKTTVKAPGSSPNTHIIPLSNLDLLSGRFPVTYIYFYQKPAHVVRSIADTLKSSLTQCLAHFYPFSGRVVQNPKSHEPEIICDNTGVLIVEAEAAIPLKKFNFHDLDQSIPGKLVSIDDSFPVQVQITSYACGGVSLTFTFDHALGDASSFAKFLVTWSETAMKRPVSCIPDHSRNLRPRFPPSYDPSLDDEYITCTIDEIRNMPTISSLIKHLYYVDASNIQRLQELASINGVKRTKIEAFSAYIWKIMAKVIGDEYESCKLGWLVDGRTRISKIKDAMSDYIGNVLSIAFGESSLTDLRQGSVADVADVVHKAIDSVTNEEHFRNLIDWIELHRPGLMLSKNVLGLGGPALVVSSGRRFPVSELDFGFGSPVLGTMFSTIERIGVGYINQRESAKGDGSWILSTILWPEMIAALKSDPDHILQPMNLNHLQL